MSHPEHQTTLHQHPPPHQTHCHTRAATHAYTQPAPPTLSAHHDAPDGRLQREGNRSTSSAPLRHPAQTTSKTRAGSPPRPPQRREPPTTQAPQHPHHSPYQSLETLDRRRLRPSRSPRRPRCCELDPPPSASTPVRATSSPSGRPHARATTTPSANSPRPSPLLHTAAHTSAEHANPQE